MTMPIISLQLSEDLLERFEKVRSARGISSKSEALRGAIVSFIENEEEFNSMKGYKIFNINLVYTIKDVVIDEISELLSQFNNIVKSVSDWRIGEKKIELILAVGEFGLIKDLHDKLSQTKDVLCSMHEIIID